MDLVRLDTKVDGGNILMTSVTFILGKHYTFLIDWLSSM
jgi:hypothetical protein